MEGAETLRQVALATLDSEDGDVSALLRLGETGEELNVAVLTQVLTALIAVTARSARMTPREVLDVLFREAPTDGEWESVAY